MQIEKIISGVKEAVRPQKWHASRNIFALLIGTILSANTTDENAEKALKKLFVKYRTPEQIANAPLSKIKRLIYSSGYYNTKANHIKQLCKILVKKYSGKVPTNREELMKLPGVGQKTSGIILVYGFNKSEAIPVDTHVFRVVNRLGLVKEKSRDKTEFKLMKIVPRKYWREFNSLFVQFGRKICQAKKPLCSQCPIKKYCKYYSTSCLKRKFCK